MESGDLLPCPFCGERVELRLESSFGSDNPTEYWRIYCSCPMGSPDVLYDVNQKENIIKDWNRRA